MQLKEIFDWLAGILPLAGIGLSWWSFRFAEDGATPDAYPEYSMTDIEREMLERGMRYRARSSARMLFGVGALLLAAAVPMGSAGNHVQDRFNVPAASAYAIILVAIAYLIIGTVRIWKARRADAFSIYFSDMMPFLYDREKAARLYFALNPMQLWTLPSRNWFAARNIPRIDDLASQAAKTSP